MKKQGFDADLPGPAAGMGPWRAQVRSVEPKVPAGMVIRNARPLDLIATIFVKLLCMFSLSVLLVLCFQWWGIRLIRSFLFFILGVFMR